MVGTPRGALLTAGAFVVAVAVADDLTGTGSSSLPLNVIPNSEMVARGLALLSASSAAFVCLSRSWRVNMIVAPGLADPIACIAFSMLAFLMELSLLKKYRLPELVLTTTPFMISPDTISDVSTFSPSLKFGEP
jgi:hypothetical protein